MDQTTQAAVSMLGMCLDAYGGLLLAYDLLGGRHGLLRWLLRMSNYSLLFIAIFVPVFGLKFALVSGVGMGSILAYELQKAAKGGKEREIGRALPVSIARCVVMGVAIALAFHVAVGVWFVIIGSLFATALAMTGKVRGIEYKPEIAPKITRQMVAFAAGRAMIVGSIGLVSGLLAGSGAGVIWLAAEIGLAVGMSIAGVALVAPLVEMWVDRVPEKIFGQVGTLFFIIGFCLQAVPSAAVLLR